MPHEFDITPWLAGIGLGEYAEAFRNNHIDAGTLHHLTDADLKEIGVASLGHRKKLLAEIRRLCGELPAAPAVEEPVKATEFHEPIEPAAAAPEPGEPHSEPPAAEPVVAAPQPGVPSRERASAEPAASAPPKTGRSSTTQVSPAAKSALPAHAENAPPPKTFRGRILASKFLIGSIAAHLLFGIGATYFIVQRYSEKRKVTFQSGPPSVNKSTRALEHKISMAQKKKTGGAPPQARRIATTGLSALALPDMPTTSTADTVVPGMAAGMGGAGFGLGMGFGSGMGGGMGGGGGGGGMTMFGFRGGGAGLIGHFYDLKQSRSGKENGMTVQRYGEVVANFVRDGWRPQILNEYFKSPSPLVATQIMIPNMSADEGPKAFELEKQVKPSRWLVHYKGRVSPPKSGTYHFVGAGDDVMFVRFNGKLVLARCWFAVSDWKPVANYNYGYTRIPNGFAKGDAIKVEAGRFYDMEVLIGEQHGGLVFFSLLIEEEGATYAMDGRGNPILPVFRLAATKMPALRAGESFPPFKPDGPIWRAQPSGGVGSLLDALR